MDSVFQIAIQASQHKKPSFFIVNDLLEEIIIFFIKSIIQQSGPFHE
ncbi:hypothetical protein H9636_04675 [Ureibacillus sp. Re31]|uniref:Uncharacterized protein n=1 Tax=Ureibacillus galli TaxID=2762222 RepID=A0ABR8X9S3_9BACL|nr:hypothetical protein [Ureibacillus galli]